MIESFFQKIKIPSAIPATFVEVFSKGILILGEASSGKTTLAFDLLSKGHRLIADDIVKIKKKKNELIGSCIKSSFLMEIKSLGIINAKDFFGPKAVLKEKSIDFVVSLDPPDYSGSKPFLFFDVMLPMYSLSKKRNRLQKLVKIALRENQSRRLRWEK